MAKQNINTRNIVLLIIIVFITIMRLLTFKYQSWSNFTPVGAIAIFSGVYFSEKWKAYIMILEFMEQFYILELFMLCHRSVYRCIDQKDKYQYRVDHYNSSSFSTLAGDGSTMDNVLPQYISGLRPIIDSSYTFRKKYAVR